MEDKALERLKVAAQSKEHSIQVDPIDLRYLLGKLEIAEQYIELLQKQARQGSK